LTPGFFSRRHVWRGFVKVRLKEIFSFFLYVFFFLLDFVGQPTDVFIDLSGWRIFEGFSGPRLGVLWCFPFWGFSDDSSSLCINPTLPHIAGGDPWALRGFAAFDRLYVLDSPIDSFFLS